MQISLILSAIMTFSSTHSASSPLDILMRRYAETRGFTSGTPQSFRFTSDGKAVLFLRSPKNELAQRLYELDIATHHERELVTISKNNAELSVTEKARLERQRISVSGLTSFQLSADNNWVSLVDGGQLCLFHRGKRTLDRTPVHDVIDPVFSPDSQAIAYVRNHDLYLYQLATRHEERLTTTGNENNTNGLAEFVAQEEMNRIHGFWWSPDSQAIAFEQSDTTHVEQFHIADPTHPEKPPLRFPYPRAGKTNAVTRIAVVRLRDKKTQSVIWDFSRYEYIANVTWEKNSPLCVLVQTRDQKDEALLRVDEKTGQTRLLLSEHDDKWINLYPEMPKWLETGSQFLWLTERDGALVLELYDSNGHLLRNLVDHHQSLRSVVGVDELHRQVWILTNENGLYDQLATISLEGGQLISKPGPAAGREVSLSKNAQYYIEQTRTQTALTQTFLFTREGRKVGEIVNTGELPALQVHAQWVHHLGAQQFNAVVIRPQHFSSTQKYPVLMSVYGGPNHNQVLPSASSYLREQWFADHGFIVVAIDGRGTPLRGREWERAIAGNFAEVTLQDQVDGLAALGEKFVELDLQRVGIFGWSFGGYMAALAVLKRPDVYHAAVAGAPVVDWHDYDTYYTERYLGAPQQNLEGYQFSNLLTYAESLTRPLMVVHGSADDNVYFFHSLKLTRALLKSDGPFSFVPLVERTHHVWDADDVQNLYRLMLKHFQTALK